MLECVINISEGRDDSVLANLTDSCSTDLLDVHTDAFHHRSVFTTIGQLAARHLSRRAIDSLDISRHRDGVHPRLGIVDVVPFVPLFQTSMLDAITARDEFANWAAHELGVPCFLYGPAGGSLPNDRTLPQVRAHAWHELRPDVGPQIAHPTAGAMCVGARAPLIAFNIWMEDPSGGDTVRLVARSIRSDHVRALALPVGDAHQVSMNLIDPDVIGPSQVQDTIAHLIRGTGARIQRCELVGLLPRSVLSKIPRTRWEELDLADERTIEYRLDHPWARFHMDE